MLTFVCDLHKNHMTSVEGAQNNYLHWKTVYQGKYPCVENTPSEDNIQCILIIMSAFAQVHQDLEAGWEYGLEYIGMHCKTSTKLIKTSFILSKNQLIMINFQDLFSPNLFYSL